MWSAEWNEGSGNAGTYDILKSKMAGATLKGDGFNMSDSTARTDDGIKNLDNWLSGLGFNWRENEALDVVLGFAW